MLLIVSFIIKKKDIHQEMREELKVHSLKTIVIPADEVIWMDKHEIWINDQMFDISTQKLENGVFTFTGLYDEKETELITKEKETEKGNKDKILSHLIHCIQNQFYRSALQLNDGFTLSLYAYSMYASKTASAYLEIITPPPQAPALIYTNLIS